MNSELCFTGGAVTACLTLRQSARARVLRLRVDPRTGAISLTVPKRVSQRRALAWAAGQRSWIETALAEIPAAVPIAPGSDVPLYGLKHLLDWRAEVGRTPRVEDGRITLGGPIESLAPRLLRWLRRHARETLDRETREFAAKAGAKVASIGVGDPVSRWGSCSAKGAIRYNWRLILAPEWVRRATVAHEVAHLVHLNHGKAFHALVASLLEADPRPARLWLRREGASLHRFGRS